MTKYYELIEFIKTEYLDNSHMNIGEEIPDVVNKIKAEFDIKVCQHEGGQYRHVKKYEIQSRNGSAAWSIIVGPVSLLYAASLEKYRVDLISNNSIKGIFTLKNAFFRYSSIPTAVIVLGDVDDEIWLTSAISTEDVISLMKNIHEYQRKVYFTKELDTANFMPEYYNGEMNEVNSALDKYETKELQEIADIISGKNAKPHQLSEEGIPYLRGRNLQEGKIVNVDTYVPFDAVGEFSKQLLEEGDILLQKQFGYHKIARVTEDDLPAIASSGLFIIRAFDVLEDYLYSYLTSETGKAIFEKQLKSIERGATIVSIGLADLRKIRVPLFDEQTMVDFANIDKVSIKDLIPTISRISSGAMEVSGTASNIGATELEKKVYDDFISAGWDEVDIKMNEAFIQIDKATRWEPDIALFSENELLAVVEVRGNFALIHERWIRNMNAIISSGQTPILIISNGAYYEVHSTKNGAVKKLLSAPTKEALLSLLTGKEAN